ncbi:TolC family protein [soil metagenome]
MRIPLVITSLLFANYIIARPAVQTKPVMPLSIQDAVNFAIKNSAQVKNALLDVQIQYQTNKEITAAAFPQINGTLGFQDYLSIPTSLIPAEFAGGPPGTYFPVKFGTKYNANTGIDIQQLLFEGQVFVGLMARKTSIEFAQANAQVTQEQIKTNVYKIYYQLVVGKRQITSIDANILRFQKLLHDVTEIYRNGFAEKLDVNKVEVQLNNLRTEKVKADNQLEAGYSGLKFLMSMPPSQKIELTDTLSEAMIKQGILDSAYSYQERKEYQLLNLASKLNEFNIRRYRLSKIPTVAGSFSYSKNAQRQKFDFFKSGGDWFTTSFIGLRISVPIFDGGARNARISRAKLELQKTLNNIEQLKLSIDNDVEQARLRFSTAVITIDAQKRNMELAEQVYNTTKLKYEQGLGSNQEIYNAQTELRVAQNNYYASLYDAINARIDYLRATGKL